MSDEDAFIRALRERPDDETARLVYTDWLDDRSDPRAEYLRAEAAWVALQPSDEQYRPLYRCVSQLAAGLEPEWFATVSRMGHLVRRAWDLVSHAFGPAPPDPDAAQGWNQMVAVLPTILDGVFGPERWQRAFCPPADFMAFMLVIGSAKWKRDAARLTAVAKNLADRVFTPERADAAGREMWLAFSWASDDSWHCVCCDLDSAIFGVVSESTDEPWRPGGDASAGFCGRNVLEFLSGYCFSFHVSDAPQWEPIPREEWATH